MALTLPQQARMLQQAAEAEEAICTLSDMEFKVKLQQLLAALRCTLCAAPLDQLLL